MHLWQNAVNTRNINAIAALYDANAVLYATFKKRLNGRAEIVEYFRNLFEKHTSVFINRSSVRKFEPCVLLYSGKYTFHVGIRTQPARFTMACIRDEHHMMKIIEHHMSADPEEWYEPDHEYGEGGWGYDDDYGDDDENGYDPRKLPKPHPNSNTAPPDSSSS